MSFTYEEEAAFDGCRSNHPVAGAHCDDHRAYSKVERQKLPTKREESSYHQVGALFFYAYHLTALSKAF
ncbi:hypothetical protein SAMN05877753_102592 [Bacillus oleivorans]|uniref:Uncharacterized protein n=1 Tax=Bacillus oleivorans TaxID=1448271 RepID=A0A285CLY6_9BACI|nr:hypothetical protein SAMN05877753_102592 [Bacillus oleivorans]